MLHAIVDSIYIQKKNAQADEYVELTEAISQATGLWIDIEGIYNWIAFLPSRQDSFLSVANRYFGVFENGEVKVRGLETRRGDTPPFIRHAQNEMILILARAKNRAEFGERAREVLELACSYLDQLRSGQVPLPDLAITQRLSHDPNQYTKNTLNAVVAKQLLGDGVELAPGESIQYVILESKAQAYADRARALEQLDGSVGYDVEKYEELLLRSVVTLLAPIGVTQPTLDKQVAEWRALPPSKRLPLSPPQAELPLFEWARINSIYQHSMLS
jgi:DNA polymerase elongation subunit (family B)